MAHKYGDVENSYGRCLRSHDFITHFYKILLASDPRIPPLFAKTDWRKQNLALRRGITNAILYGSGINIARDTIEKMAKVHSRKGRVPVKPEFHSLWLNSLMQAIRDRDPQYSESLEAHWRAALTPTIDLFTSVY